MMVRLFAWRFVLPCVVVSVLIGSSGCGGGAEPPDFLGEMVPATGTVTLDGEPLAGATVMFRPDEKGTGGEVAVGVSDAQGKYEMTTLVAGRPAGEPKGAVPGRYRVTVTKIVMPDGSPVPAGTSDADAEAEGARQLLPPHYSDPEQTVLNADVQSSPSVNDFELKGGR